MGEVVDLGRASAEAQEALAQAELERREIEALRRLVQTGEWAVYANKMAQAVNQNLEKAVNEVGRLSDGELRALVAFVSGLNKAADLPELLIRAHNARLEEAQATADNPPEPQREGLRPSPFEEG